MAKERKRKTAEPKLKSVKFFVFNVKLLSNERHGTQAYSDMISYLFQKRVISDVPHDKQMILRTQFSTKIENEIIYYGKISRFTKLDGKDWINLENLEAENVEIPKNRFPNLKETEYVFVPSAHRFAISKNNEVGISSTFTFLKHALKEATNSNEQYEVYIEQSQDIFEEIYEAEAIEKLKIDISYTNDDIVEGAEEWMDNLLKGAGIKNFSIEASADQKNNISIENQILSGALGLAKSNGKVIARIVSKNDTRKTILTEEHPQDFSAQYKELDEKTKAVGREILKQFRNE